MQPQHKDGGQQDLGEDVDAINHVPQFLRHAVLRGTQGARYRACGHFDISNSGNFHDRLVENSRTF